MEKEAGWSTKFPHSKTRWKKIRRREERAERTVQAHARRQLGQILNTESIRLQFMGATVFSHSAGNPVVYLYLNQEHCEQGSRSPIVVVLGDLGHCTRSHDFSCLSLHENSSPLDSNDQIWVPLALSVSSFLCASLSPTLGCVGSGKKRSLAGFLLYCVLSFTNKLSGQSELRGLPYCA